MDEIEYSIKVWTLLQNGGSPIIGAIFAGLFFWFCITKLNDLEKAKKIEENRPQLTIAKFGNTTFEANKPMILRPIITTLQGHVVKIHGVRMSFNYAPENTYLSSIEGIEQTLWNADILKMAHDINDQPNHSFNITTKEIIAKETYDLVKNGTYQLYSGISVFYDYYGEKEFYFLAKFTNTGSDGVEILKTVTRSVDKPK